MGGHQAPGAATKTRMAGVADAEPHELQVVEASAADRVLCELGALQPGKCHFDHLRLQDLPGRCPKLAQQWTRFDTFLSWVALPFCEWWHKKSTHFFWLVTDQVNKWCGCGTKVDPPPGRRAKEYWKSMTRGRTGKATFFFLYRKHIQSVCMTRPLKPAPLSHGTQPFLVVSTTPQVTLSWRLGSVVRGFEPWLL